MNRPEPEYNLSLSYCIVEALTCGRAVGVYCVAALVITHLMGRW